MLVIISDLHLTDGTSGETISSSAFKLFRNRLSDMAYDASWKNDDDYKPIPHVDLFLLGDILDMIRSEKWNQALENIMPWTDKRQDDFFAEVDLIVDDILKHNQASFNILKALAKGGLKIPAAITKKSDDEKEASEEMATVKVNIYYMIGNHDWFFYISDPRMNPIRNKVIDALGLANERDKPFPHSPNEDSQTAHTIEQIQREHRDFANHGDEYDSTNYQTPHRDMSSIGDVVVIKLLNEIPKRIEQHLVELTGRNKDDEDIKTFVNELRELDNLRPYQLAPAWITEKLEETQLELEIVNKAIKQALREAIGKFRQNIIVSKNKKLNYRMKIVDILLAGNFNIKNLSILLSRLRATADKFESYKKYAVLMAKDQQRDFFVMGHTHYPEVVPLSTYSDGGIKRKKIYINTGTWRSLHKTGFEDKSFISYKTITLVGFFKPDERKGRAFEFWTGSLAI